jgi:hypothetical protein
MKEPTIQTDESSYKLVIDILADLIKEFRVSYDTPTNERTTVLTKTK